MKTIEIFGEQKQVEMYKFIITKIEWDIDGIEEQLEADETIEDLQQYIDDLDLPENIEFIAAWPEGHEDCDSYLTEYLEDS